MAECSYHPGKEAVGGCVNCGKMVCQACRTELHDKIYCPSCANQLFVLRSEAQPAAAATAAPVTQAEQPAVTETTPAAAATPALQPVSGAWWLLVILPIFFGGWNFIGGIIAWAVNRNKDPRKARSMLIWGILLTVIYIVLVIGIAILFAIGFLEFEGMS